MANLREEARKFDMLLVRILFWSLFAVFSYIVAGIAVSELVFPAAKPDISQYFDPGDHLVSRFEGFDQTVLSVNDGWLHSRLEVAPHAVQAHRAQERDRVDAQHLLEAVLQRAADHAELATEIGHRDRLGDVRSHERLRGVDDVAPTSACRRGLRCTGLVGDDGDHRSQHRLLEDALRLVILKGDRVLVE